MQLSPEFIATAQQAFALFNQGNSKSPGTIRVAPGAISAHPSLLNLAAVCARPLGLTDKAETYLRLAIEVQPDYANAHVNLGLVLQDAKQFERCRSRVQARTRPGPNGSGHLDQYGQSVSVDSAFR